jgi:hypothetical protein
VGGHRRRALAGALAYARLTPAIVRRIIAGVKAPEDRVLLLASVVASVIALLRLKPDEEEVALEVVIASARGRIETFRRQRR